MLPAPISQVLDATTEVIIDVVNWAFDQCADYYVLAEPSSRPALMSPRTWKQFVQPSIILSGIRNQANLIGIVRSGYTPGKYQIFRYL
jgi:hypothetical protein